MFQEDHIHTHVLYTRKLLGGQVELRSSDGHTRVGLRARTLTIWIVTSVVQSVSGENEQCELNETSCCTPSLRHNLMRLSSPASWLGDNSSG